MSTSPLKIPTRVKVGPYTYKVTSRDHAWLQVNGVYGLCHTGDLTIDVVNTTDSAIVLDTLIHEIFHALWDSLNMKDADGEERIITTLATGFTAVLMDNPKLGTLINTVRKQQRKE